MPPRVAVRCQHWVMLASVLLLLLSVQALDRVQFLIGTQPVAVTTRRRAAWRGHGLTRCRAISKLDYKGGAGGTIALAHFVGNHRNERNTAGDRRGHGRRHRAEPDAD